MSFYRCVIALRKVDHINLKLYDDIIPQSYIFSENVKLVGRITQMLASESHMKLAK